MKLHRDQFIRYIEEDRLIVSVKEARHLEKALASPARVIFLLTGNIGVVKRYVQLFQQEGKLVFLHMEKIGGLSCDKEGMHFLSSYLKPTGIVSTKNSMIKLANRLGLLTIQRLFLIDHDALHHGLQSVEENQPDAVEVMPALLPSYLDYLRSKTEYPLITGGLIQNQEQMKLALCHGAKAVSTGTPVLWKELPTDVKNSYCTL